MLNPANDRERSQGAEERTESCRAETVLDCRERPGMAQFGPHCGFWAL